MHPVQGQRQALEAKRVRLLIVDDSADIRSALRQIALDHQHEVVGEAENGKDALDIIRGAAVDLVLLDVSMPVMGGFETACQMSQIAPELPIVFISQHAGADYVKEAFRLGARGYLL